MLALRVTVRGESMAPALHEGDRLLALRYWPRRRGAIVVCSLSPGPGEPPWLWVKRLIAVGGDVARVPRARLHPGERPERTGGRLDGDDVVWDVPKGYVFVKGDADSSADSTGWGPIPRSAVVGVVVKQIA